MAMEISTCWQSLPEVPIPPRQEKSLPPFLRKLQNKQQSKTQQEQAAAAITLYYDILREKGKLGTAPPLQPVSMPA